MQHARTRTLMTMGLTAALAAIVAVVVAPSTAWSMRTHGSTDVRTGAARATGGYGFKAAEICFMRKINRVRQNNGLRALRWDKQMGYVARRHARQMATNNSVYHDGNMGSEITRWRRLAQNTGAGRNCKSLFRSFMRSPSHRTNILGTWRFMAVGIDYRGSKIFTQQIFENYENPGNVYHWP